MYVAVALSRANTWSAMALRAAALDALQTASTTSYVSMGDGGAGGENGGCGGEGERSTIRCMLSKYMC